MGRGAVLIWVSKGLESAGFSERRLPRFPRVRAPQFRLAVGDLNRKIDALIDQFAEAFEVREERFEVGHLFGPNIPGAAAHVVGVTYLPVRAGFRGRILKLLAQGAGPHGSELGQLGLGSSELGLPFRDSFIFHVMKPPSARDLSPAGG